MKKPMDAMTFVEVLKIINCMDHKEFCDLFGETLGSHISTKRSQGTGIKFLFELDITTLEKLFEYACKKHEQREVV